ncbi:MAG: porin [Ideonella sp.]|nr:porin [Ideonella sp.]
MPACGLGRKTASISFPISQTKKEKTLKIKLLAATALCACAGAASAQSSVTLFGIVDLNGRWLDNDGTSQFSMSQGGTAASRLGFRGTEDLGGGLYAGFWIEGALNPDTGTSGGQTWQRRSTVSLSSPWGEARLGRDNTVTYYNTTTFDPFGDSGIGAAGNLTLKPPAVPVGGAYDTLVRASNMAAYFLPAGVAGGLYGGAQVAAGENAYGNKFFGARLGYAAGPFDVNVAWGQTQVSSDSDGDALNIGASWKFGFMKLSGFYGQIKVEDDKQDNWFIGATAPYGVWIFKASYGQARRSGTNPANVEGQKADQIAFGATYSLSKRTLLYGTWSGISNKGGANFVVGSLNNIAGGGAAPNADSQGAEFGVRHSF